MKTLNLILNKLKLFWKDRGPDFIVILFLVIIWTSFLVYNSHLKREAKTAKLTLQAVTDSMICYRNSNGENVARIAVLEDDNSRALLRINSDDSTIMMLQVEIENHKKQLKPAGSSATAITNTTHNSGTIPTIIPKPVNPTSYPTYTGDVNSKWLTLSIIANHDSVHYDIKTRNAYSVIIGTEKNKTFAEVTNKNPYTETTSIRSYEVTIPKPKRLSFGIQVGYGVVGGGLSPYIGFGFNYSLINIR